MGCSSNPCLFGSTCENTDNGGHICLCISGYTGSNCATRIQGNIIIWKEKKTWFQLIGSAVFPICLQYNDVSTIVFVFRDVLFTRYIMIFRLGCVYIFRFVNMKLKTNIINIIGKKQSSYCDVLYIYFHRLCFEKCVILKTIGNSLKSWNKLRSRIKS